MPRLKRFAYLLTILSIFEMHSTTLAQVPVEPNIILIVCDDLNDFEGVFGGHPQAQTPNMDALAASGVTFINAHSNAPICGPSRSSFVTGIYPHTSNNYAFENWYNPGKSNFAVNPILENSKTLMRYMRDNVIASGERAAFRLSVPALGRYVGWNVDNVAISGEAVPEPKTYALILGSLVLLFGWYYRRR